MDNPNQLALELLEELTQAHGAPGCEGPVRQAVRARLEPLGEVEFDRTGSVACRMAGLADGPSVLVAGHLDEVGFMVQNITPEGFIQFVPLGGWWAHTVLAQRVRIRTAAGREVPGVTTSVPPHLLPPEARSQVMPLERMFIDVGASSRSEVIDDFGIRLGDPIVPESPFTRMANSDRFMAKAFDNRVGMAAAIQAGILLAARRDPLNRPIIAGTVQEEVGTRGAQTLATLLSPDVAIILEGPPADDIPGLNPMESQGALGRGTQVRLYDPSAIMNRQLADFVIATAENAGIPHQVAVRRSGGTDAKAIHLSSTGVPCVVLGVPARYIHSHNAIIDVNDYLATVALTEAVVSRLDRGTVASLTEFAD